MNKIEEKKPGILARAAGWIDRAVETVSPGWGVSRKRERARLGATRGYHGADGTRNSMRAWTRNSASPNQINIEDRADLIDATNDLDRNNAIARGAATKSVECVIGKGLGHKAKIDHEVVGLGRDQAQDIERTLERLWRIWARARFSDVTQGGNFHALVRTSRFDRFIDGDCLLVRRYKSQRGSRRRAILGTCFQIVRGGRIGNREGGADSATKVAGVNLDGDGVPLSYDIRKGDPGEDRERNESNSWVTIRAFDSMGDAKARLLFERRRTGEYRGVPALAASIEILKQLGDYQHGVASAAVLQSFFTAFIKTKNATGISTENESLVDKISDLKSDETGFGAGTFIPLFEDEEVTLAQSSRNSSEFESFFAAMLKLVGMVTQIPFQVLLGHFSSSYSAARGEILEAWRHFKLETRKDAEDIYQMAYEAVVAESVDRGLVDLPGFYSSPMVRAAYLGTEWTGQATPQIDEVKAVKASLLKIDGALSTGTREASEINGSDFEENQRILGQERRDAELHKIPDYRTTELIDEPEEKAMDDEEQK